MTDQLERRVDNAVPAAGGLEEFLGQLLRRRENTAEKRARSQQKAEAVLLLAREQGREDLEPEEDAEYRKYMKDMKSEGAEIIGLDERIDEVRGEVERSGQISQNLAKIRRAETARTKVTEQLTYQKGNNRRSYVKDLIKLTLNMDGDGESRGRLMRHAQDVAEDESYKEYRDISRVDGQGGYAVPPAWLMDQYIELARPGRAFANLVQRQPLPGGTDSINIPKLLTGTTVGVQTADNTPISKTDLTDTFINAPVRTIAGAQGVSIQLIDQSPIAFDDVVFRDLVAAHAASTDTPGAGRVRHRRSGARCEQHPRHLDGGLVGGADHPDRVFGDRQRGPVGPHHPLPATRGHRHAPSEVGMVPVPAGRPAASAVPAEREQPVQRGRRPAGRGVSAGRGHDARAAGDHRPEHHDDRRTGNAKRKSGHHLCFES